VGFFAFVAVLDAAVGTERVSFNKRLITYGHEPSARAVRDDTSPEGRYGVLPVRCRPSAATV
jgi:hypothetical protein